MKKFCLLVFLVPIVLVSNPIKLEIINEFQTDTTQRIEYHPNFMGGSLLNDSLLTPAGLAIIDTPIYIPDTGYAIIDTSVLSGPFFLPPDSGFMISLTPRDTVIYPYDGYYYIVPVPPPGTSAAKFYLNLGIDGWLKDWYIDSTPTFGYANDDYHGCRISGYVYDSSGSPIINAQVITRTTFDIYVSHPFYECCTTYTASTGFYSFDSLLPTSYWVKVNTFNYEPDSQMTAVLHSIEPLTNFNFYLVGINEFNNTISLKPKLEASPSLFRRTTTIRYSIPAMTEKSFNTIQPFLKIYDASGRIVKSFRTFGQSNAVRWNGDDNGGRLLPSGIYFITVPGKRIKVIKL